MSTSNDHLNARSSIAICRRRSPKNEPVALRHCGEIRCGAEAGDGRGARGDRRRRCVRAVNRTVSTAVRDRTYAGYEEAVEEVMREANEHGEHFKRSLECEEFYSYLPKKIAEE